MERITIQTKLDQDTLSKGVKAIMDNVAVMKGIKYFGYLMVVTGLILFVSVFKLESYAPLMAVFIGLVFVFFTTIMAYFNVRKIGPGDKVYEDLQYTIEPKKILIRGQSFEGYINWEDLKEVAETTDFFLLYQGTLVASILPKSDFTQIQKENFRRMILSVPDLKNNL